MTSIVDGILKFRVLVMAIAAAVAFFGYERLGRMPIDVLPEFNPPTIEVQTEAPGLSAKEVEVMVTFGVEELLSGLPWVKSLNSESVTGLSTVRLTYDPGADLMRARQLVQERLTSSFLLPNVAKAPVMQQPISSTNRVLMIALSSKDIDPIRLSTIIQWTVKPRLLGVPGVANVSAWGERRRQVQVQMIPEKMAEHKVRQHQIITSTGDALWMSPLSFLKSSVPGTGGWVESPNQRLEIRHVLPMTSADDIAKIGIDGTNLRLGDVARVVEGHPPLIGDAVLPDGQPGILLVIEKLPGANTIEVTRAIESAMASLKSGLGGVEIDMTAFRPATFVGWFVDNVARVAAFGLALGVLGLGLLLGQWRAMLVGAIVVPLALLAALGVIAYRGGGLNALMFAGLAAATVCMVADTATAMQQLSDQLRSKSVSLSSAIAGVGSNLSRPLGFASMITLLMLVPAAFLGGLEGAIIQPTAVAFALAMTASVVVTFTVVPVLQLLLGQSGIEQAPASRGDASHIPLLGAPVALGLCAATLAVAVVSVFWTGAFKASTVALMPTFQERELVIQFDGPGGTSHGEMMRLSTKLIGDLHGVPGVRSAYAHIGRAIGGDLTVNMNAGRVWVGINSGADYAATLTGIRKVLDGYPEMNRRIRTYLGDRLGTEIGDRQQIVVRVYGQLVDELRRQVADVKRVLGQIDGLGTVRIEDQTEEEQLNVTVDLEAAARHGLKPGDVRRAAATVFSGLEVGRIFEAQKVFEVVVWSRPEARRSVESLADTLIELPNGGHLRMGEVAKVAIKNMPAQIKREGVSPYLDVVTDVGRLGHDAALREVSTKIKSISFPFGYFPVVLEESVASSGMRQVAVASIVTAALVFLLLQAYLQSWRLAASTFLVLPLSLVGGLAVMALFGLPLSLGPIAGLIAISALTLRLALPMIGEMQRLEAAPGSVASIDQVRAVVASNGRTIIATLGSVALSMAPIAWLSGRPGLEVLAPMAAVVLGGLATTALVLLLVLPSLYTVFGNDRQLELQLGYSS